ncbi:hypothetical protein FB567DRAFT_82682 [Paraphoma chrysanthemicola]|uniref:Uncharacterized protein n=1 Tax=Paraphoma chrysanthemicola TaxID=798071 RepID=A0A8K0R305_9PLEO|nr:hypothetical protein FB567DRAFT_82682 [Paraphoma chrysanthemicola]
MPDINSLPPSPLASPSPSNDTSRNQSPSATRTMASPSPHSLAATAAMNAGIQNEETRRSSSGSMRREVERARRRSSIRLNLNLNDPSVPAPGEMQRSPSAARSRGLPQSPHHERAPSLGELHQELEYEQEGQVNRLLNMIRQQQAQISTLQANQQQPSSSAVDDSTPTSERSLSLSHSVHPSHAAISPLPITNQPRSHSPFGISRGSISRQSSFADRSRGGSHTGSPALRPMSGQGGVYDYNDMLPGSATGRDESAFYQAETQNLTRENQMLKLRIRELERQLADMNPTSPVTRSPVIHSSLNPLASRENTEPSTNPAPPASSE